MCCGPQHIVAFDVTREVLHDQADELYIQL